MTKLCRTCGKRKTANEFYKSRRDGLQARCKLCSSAAHRLSLSDAGTRERQYGKNRIWKNTHREKVLAYTRRWEKSHPRDPYKERARRILRYAVRTGKIVRPQTCSNCGWKGKPHGHHRDYNRPLEVTWLCRICHGCEHRKYKD